MDFVSRVPFQLPNTEIKIYNPSSAKDAENPIFCIFYLKKYVQIYESCF